MSENNSSKESLGKTPNPQPTGGLLSRLDKANATAPTDTNFQSREIGVTTAQKVDTFEEHKARADKQAESGALRAKRDRKSLITIIIVILAAIALVGIATIIIIIVAQKQPTENQIIANEISTQVQEADFEISQILEEQGIENKSDATIADLESAANQAVATIESKIGSAEDGQPDYSANPESVISQMRIYASYLMYDKIIETSTKLDISNLPDNSVLLAEYCGLLINAYYSTGDGDNAEYYENYLNAHFDNNTNTDGEG